MELKTTIVLTFIFLTGSLFPMKSKAQEAPPGPVVLLDSKPLSKQNLVFNLDNRSFVRVDVLGQKLFRIRYSKTGHWTESALNRYGIFMDDFPEIPFDQAKHRNEYLINTKEARLSINKKDGEIVLFSKTGKVLIKQPAPEYEASGGFIIRFKLTEDERIYGLGDVSRENIMRRGGTYELWVKNVNSYIPIPVMMSSRGWGILMNTTWRNSVDVGKTKADQIIWSAGQSDLDYYLFCGPDYRSLLETYTSFSGRPALLPVWGYGFSYVCNQQVDAFRMLEESRTFRNEDMPCDIIGLEPGWMSKYYDFSTEKKWDPNRFYIPSWAPKGDQTFIGALGRLGYKLSLWLCCDYDLSVYEEQLLKVLGPAGQSVTNLTAIQNNNGDDFEQDVHLNKPSNIEQDTVAEQAMGQKPWFDHLKTFVDQGVRAFKLDGANQVIEHSKRKWGNGMTDEEMHNLYPVIYAKQMCRGFEDQTLLRSMVYSAAGYAGVQQFVATWAGDTGGGPKTLVSMLNLGISGHSNHSCDLDVFSAESIHFGFLQTWSQLNNWAYWRQPWYLQEERKEMFREYGQLRYKLLPYVYSTAAEAASTGYPVMRSMSMCYPDNPEWDDKLGQYMFGDFFLVAAFSDEVYVPEGTWYDFWNGKKITGPATIPVVKTIKHGGALLIKSGAIVPTWPFRENVSKGWSSEINLLVYPADSSAFTLYEDDGNSLGYRKGEFARTVLTCETKNESIKLTIGGRQGSFTGMPAERDFTAIMHLDARPKSVNLDGKAMVNYGWDERSLTATFDIPACGSKPRILVCR